MFEIAHTGTLTTASWYRNVWDSWIGRGEGVEAFVSTYLWNSYIPVVSSSTCHLSYRVMYKFCSFAWIIDAFLIGTLASNGLSYLAACTNPSLLCWVRHLVPGLFLLVDKVEVMRSSHWFMTRCLIIAILMGQGWAPINLFVPVVFNITDERGAEGNYCTNKAWYCSGNSHLTKGYGKGTFRPGDLISYADKCRGRYRVALKRICCWIYTACIYIYNIYI